MRGFGGVSRRNMLIGGVAAPFIGAAGTGPVRAAAPMLGGAMAPFHRFALGGFEVTTLLAGTRTVDNPHGIFGMNVSDEAFDEAAQAAFIPSDQAQFFFTPTLVNTGAELVLFDTGMAPGGITAALAAAGYTPRSDRCRCFDPYAWRPHRWLDAGWRGDLCQCPLCDGCG